jgi:DNA-binding NarL/FixJ family response regulator
MIKVLIYEDNTQLRDVISILLNGTDGFEMVGAFANCSNILDDCDALKPDVILMDINMPGCNGIEGLKLLRTKYSDIKVLMLTVFDDNNNIFESIRNGANGYLLKKTPPARLLEYTQDAQSGGAPMTSSIASQVLKMFSATHSSVRHDWDLSEREKSVLNLIVQGYSYKLIAAELFISLDTVRSHIRKIYEKLHVNSKSEAVAKALKARGQ